VSGPQLCRRWIKIAWAQPISQGNTEEFEFNGEPENNGEARRECRAGFKTVNVNFQ
jgi:hypothetical protein